MGYLEGLKIIGNQLVTDMTVVADLATSAVVDLSDSWKRGWAEGKAKAQKREEKVAPLDANE
jgi:hypothetical protein